jgi:hypothetical protein
MEKRLKVPLNSADNNRATNKGATMRRILSITTLAIMLVLIALPAVATGKHGKPEVSSTCDTLTVTADKKAEWTAYIGDGDVTMKGSYTFSHGQPGQYWAVVYKGKVIAEGQFEGCTTTTTPGETTTTLPVTTTVPFETIQVCRDGALVFIDPMERLESDTDECETPEETTTTQPETTTTIAPVTTQPSVVDTTAPVEAKVLPFTGIEDYLPILAGGLVMFGALVLSFMGRNKEVS